MPCGSMGVIMHATPCTMGSSRAVVVAVSCEQCMGGREGQVGGGREGGMSVGGGGREGQLGRGGRGGARADAWAGDSAMWEPILSAWVVRQGLVSASDKERTMCAGDVPYGSMGRDHACNPHAQWIAAGRGFWFLCAMRGQRIGYRWREGRVGGGRL